MRLAFCSPVKKVEAGETKKLFFFLNDNTKFKSRLYLYKFKLRYFWINLKK